MTREETIKMIENDKKRHHDELSGRYRAALTMAIQALEQEPCEDAIDRKLVCAFIGGLISDDGEREKGLEYIRSMPPVNPTKTGWIPVSERLPENAKHKGAFCPKYYVMTEFGQTEGWYNPDVGCWYVLLWFMDARFETWNISLERGDVPKLVKNVPVTAWMPLPKPYEPQERSDKE